MSGEINRYYSDIEKEIVINNFYSLPKVVIYYEQELSFK